MFDYIKQKARDAWSGTTKWTGWATAGTLGTYGTFQLARMAVTKGISAALGLTQVGLAVDAVAVVVGAVAGTTAGQRIANFGYENGEDAANAVVSGTASALTSAAQTAASASAYVAKGVIHGGVVGVTYLYNAACAEEVLDDECELEVAGKKLSSRNRVK